MILEMNFFSSELQKETHVNVLIPPCPTYEDGTYKVLWLFHGLSGDNTSWIRNSCIERYSKERKIAVIMPDVDRSWYTNSAYGINYFDFLTRELPQVCYKHFRVFSEKREDNIVAGLSMGGYGALKVALTYPERYCACISLSGSVDITRKGLTYPLDEWRSIFGFGIESALSLEGTEHDLFALATRNKSEGRPNQKLYLWCGTEDGLLHSNDTFHQHLDSLSIPHVYEVSEGDHSWKWWDLHIQSGLDAVLCDN